MPHELTTRAELQAFIRTHGHLRGQVVQELDLRDDGELLRSISGDQAAFLGCRLDADTLMHLYGSGADLFPPLDHRTLPFRPYRSGLYTVDELYAGFDPEQPGSFWTSAYDSQIYAYFDASRRSADPPSIMQALAMRLHDHAIEDALHDLLHRPERKVVAIMGGHALRRGQPIYAEIVELARTLTRAGYLVVTGGGPGAMEAGNLGAHLSAHDDDALDQALTILTGEQDYKQHRYLQLALEVRRRWPPVADRGESLAIPTWFYGHEPSNMFASHIAKYFANSVREEGLLAIATAGVIYAPGSAGTVQEVFMDACQNHYVTFEVISPMVMFGVEYWTKTLPVWPLLQAMSAGRAWGRSIALCDRGHEVAQFIADHPPITAG